MFDKNNPKDLVIPGLEIGDELVDFVVINGEEFDVEYKTSLARTNTKPAVHIVDGKLVVPVAVLEYLGLDSESLDITVNLANGQVLSKVVNLAVKDSADKEESGDKEDNVPPTTDEEDGSVDKDETDKDETDSENSNGSSNVTSKPNGNGSSNVTSKPNGNGSSNGNSNNVNSSNGTSKPNGNSTNGNAQTHLPNTGAPVSTGLIGGIIATVGVLLNRKRK